MKKFLVVCSALAVCSAGTIFADGTSAPPKGDVNPSIAVQTATAEIQTKISAVTVFPRGARVTRTASAELHAGTQKIVLGGFPLNLSESTLSATVSVPGARIMSVSSEIVGFGEQDKSAAAETLKKMEDKIFATKELRQKISVASKRIESLRGFVPTPPREQEKKGAVPAEIFEVQDAVRVADFIVSEMQRTSKSLRELEKKLAEENLELDVLRSEYSKLSSYTGTKKRVVTISVDSATAVPAGTVSVSYRPWRASWCPVYDVRVGSDHKSLTLVSYGVVSQSTGEDWDGVPIVLSTANPDSSASLPEFHKKIITERFIPAATPMLLSSDSSQSEMHSNVKTSRAVGSVQRSEFMSKRGGRQFVLSNSFANRMVTNSGKSYENAQNVYYEGGNFVFNDGSGVLQKVAAKDVAQISQNYVERSDDSGILNSRLHDPSLILRGLDFRYPLARLETIKSTGEMHRYLLSSETFDGDFYYEIVPAENSNAYQMLAVQNKNFRPLLAGPANIFYGEDFIGDMDVAYTTNGGKVTIPLGVDPRVSVSRELSVRIENVGVFKNSKRNRVTTKITVENRTPEKIKVKVKDAVPIAMQSEIEVSDIALSPAPKKYAKEDGSVVWKNEIEPGVPAIFNTSFRIDYPDGWQLNRFGGGER